MFGRECVSDNLNVAKLVMAGAFILFFFSPLLSFQPSYPGLSSPTAVSRQAEKCFYINNNVGGRECTSEGEQETWPWPRGVQHSVRYFSGCACMHIYTNICTKKPDVGLF